MKKIAIKTDGIVLAQAHESIALVAVGAEFAEGARTAEKIKIS